MDNPHLLDGDISPFTTDLNAILDHIDTAYGMPDAVRAYVYALRDLQFAYNEDSYDADLGPQEYRRIAARIEKAFRLLTQSHHATVRLWVKS
jgi:hypothetical protein